MSTNKQSGMGEIEETLGKLAEDLIAYDQRMTKAKAPNIRFVHKYIKVALAELTKELKKAERKGMLTMWLLISPVLPKIIDGTATKEDIDKVIDELKAQLDKGNTK